MNASRPTPGLTKGLLFILALLPAAYLTFALWQDQLGANPVEYLQKKTGWWTLNFLWLTLCISPLRATTGWHALIRLRRMLGLFTFFYALLHALTWAGFDHDFAVDHLARDIFKRPFILAGFAAFALMVPLALTSSNFAIRLLGGKRWQSLHRTIYPLSLIVCLHYLWLVKWTGILWPIAYCILLAGLLGWRVKHYRARAIPVTKAANITPLRFYAKRPER